VEYIIGSGVISLTEIPFQNCTVYGTGASVLNGILNSAGSGTLDFTSNSVISCSNGTGIFCRDDEFCSCFSIEFKYNIVRNLSKSAA
jgi:hypothetical protein